MGWRQRSRGEWRRLVADWPCSRFNQKASCTRATRRSKRSLWKWPGTFAGPTV